MKKGKLSKAEIFYIENSKQSVEEIAKDLDRSVALVEKHLPENKEEKSEPEQEKTAGNIDKYLQKPKDVEGVYVLTEGGSQRGDIKRSSKKSSKSEDAIFRPFKK